MKAPRLILSLHRSDCCESRMILIRSREGGFVSQNCLRCGKAYRVQDREIPDLDCDSCKWSPKGSVMVKIIDKNYVYECERCRKRWVLAELLPHWSELFPYCGLAAPGDGHFER